MHDAEQNFGSGTRSCVHTIMYVYICLGGHSAMDANIRIQMAHQHYTLLHIGNCIYFPHACA